MNLTRNGKIARLPKAVRDELNRSLANGEPGKRLVAWLNTLPEVQQVITAEFGGKPIREQNLSEWKQGGYADWVTQQEALDLAQRLGEDAAELQTEDRPPLTDTLALWLAARYAVATRQVAQTEGAGAWRLLRELCADVVELRRGDHSAERLRLEREQLEATRQCTQRERVDEFWRWASDPEVCEKVCRGFMTHAEKVEWLGKRLFAELWDDAPGSDPAACGLTAGPQKPETASSVPQTEASSISPQ